MKSFLIVSKEDSNLKLAESIINALNCHTSDKGIGYDGIIVLGGDGTVLRTLLHYRSPPTVYAINCGRVGFLCPITYLEKDELVERLKKEEEIKFFEVERLCLSPNRYFLNEAVLGSSSNRLNTFKILIDEISLVIRADAVIVSTRTGSSGYNASINGPLLLSDCMVINVLAPNRCNFRPIVCGIKSRIRVEIDCEDPLITIDGVTLQERNFEVFYDGSKVRFGYLNSYNESLRISNLFLLQ